jgi:nicotinate-nucleotide adenylyltransferase
LGGSFNPAHEGHRHISLTALAQFGLDQIWWLVSPQNPLKSARGMASFHRRLAMARASARDPRIVVTDLEQILGTRYTFDTIAALRRYYGRTHFVWLMGADNLGQIHRWQRWRGIFESVPIAVFDRPPYRLRTLSGPAASAFHRARVPQTKSRNLAVRPAPAWVFMASRLEPLSSTELRMRARRFSPESMRSDPAPSNASPGNLTPAHSTSVVALRSRFADPISPQTHSNTGIPIETQRFQRMDAIVRALPSPSAELAPAALRDSIVRSIDDDKGEDIVVVELTDKSIADFIVIATGRSSRQVGAIADHLVERLQPSLSFRIAVEGLPQGDWVLLDCGDVVVHLFRPEVRDFYAIEKMWGLEPPKFPAALNSP